MCYRLCIYSCFIHIYIQSSQIQFGIFRNKKLMVPYSDVASSVFTSNRSSNLDEIFLAAARVSNIFKYLYMCTVIQVIAS